MYGEGLEKRIQSSLHTSIENIKCFYKNLPFNINRLSVPGCG